MLHVSMEGLESCLADLIGPAALQDKSLQQPCKVTFKLPLHLGGVIEVVFIVKTLS